MSLKIKSSVLLSHVTFAASPVNTTSPVNVAPDKFAFSASAVSTYALTDCWLGGLVALLLAKLSSSIRDKSPASTYALIDCWLATLVALFVAKLSSSKKSEVLESRSPVAVTPPCQALPLYTRNSLDEVLNTRSPTSKLEVGSLLAIRYLASKDWILVKFVATVFTFAIELPTLLTLVILVATVVTLELLFETVVTFAAIPETVWIYGAWVATVVTSVALGVRRWKV